MMDFFTINPSDPLFKASRLSCAILWQGVPQVITYWGQKCSLNLPLLSVCGCPLVLVLHKMENSFLYYFCIILYMCPHGTFFLD